MKKNKIIIMVIFVSYIIFCRTNITFCTETSHEVKHEETATAEHKNSDSEHGAEEHVKAEEISNENKHEISGDAHGEKNIHVKNDGHGEAAVHGEHGIHEAPIEYYIAWSMIIIIIVMLFGYYMKFISVKGLFGSRIAEDDLEHEQDIETTGFALMVVVFAALFYGILMTPSLFGYFNSETHSFVKGYHESTSTGLLRFIVVTITGILMTLYAFLGMQHH